jgi:hypothetical protein
MGVGLNDGFLWDLTVVSIELNGGRMNDFVQGFIDEIITNAASLEAGD